MKHALADMVRVWSEKRRRASGTGGTRGTLDETRDGSDHETSEQLGPGGTSRGGDDGKFRVFRDVPATGNGEIDRETRLVPCVPDVPDDVAEVCERRRSTSLVPVRFVADMPRPFLVVAATRAGELVGFGAPDLAPPEVRVVFGANELVAITIAARSLRAYEHTFAEWVRAKRSDSAFVLTKRRACDVAEGHAFAPVPDRPHYWNETWCNDGWTLARVLDHFGLALLDVHFADPNAELYSRAT